MTPLRRHHGRPENFPGALQTAFQIAMHQKSRAGGSRHIPVTSIVLLTDGTPGHCSLPRDAALLASAFACLGRPDRALGKEPDDRFAERLCLVTCTFPSRGSAALLSA
jgi:hypothetical protein